MTPRLRHPLLLILAPLLISFLACVDKLPTDQRPCPCAPGWQCDRSGSGAGVCRPGSADRGADRAPGPTDAGDGGPADTSADTRPACAWATMASGTPHSLESIWGSGPTDIFTVGTNGTILHFDGKRWNKQAAGSTTAHLISVWGRGPSDVYAAGCSEYCLPGPTVKAFMVRYDGAKWSVVSSPAGAAMVSDIWGAPAGNLYLTGPPSSSPYYVIYSADTKGAWQGEASSQWAMWGIWGAAPADIFACGNGGAVLRHLGGGWQDALSATTSHLEDIWGSGPSDVFAVGGSHYFDEKPRGGTATIIHYNGTRWRTQLEKKHHHLMGVWGNGPSDVFAVGYGATLLHYNGKGWATMEAGLNTNLLGVWGSGPSDVFAVGDSGTILRYRCAAQ